MGRARPETWRPSAPSNHEASFLTSRGWWYFERLPALFANHDGATGGGTRRMRHDGMAWDGMRSSTEVALRVYGA